MKISTTIRIILSICLCYMVYGETGPFTTVAIALAMLHSEAAAAVIVYLAKKNFLVFEIEHPMVY